VALLGHWGAFFVHVHSHLALEDTPRFSPHLYEFAGEQAPVVCLWGAFIRACTW
jgi:hypothetical protein